MAMCIWLQLTKYANDLTSTEAGVEVLTVGAEKTINGVKYLVVKTIHDETGFQSIIFKNITEGTEGYGESILAVGGSYPTKSFCLNPVEWINDWLRNNALTGADILPPQLASTIKALDDYKTLYNITTASAHSQGAIDLGLALKLSRNSDVTGYLYNGGLPQKLVTNLNLTYTTQVNPDSSNFITLMSQDEPLSKLLTWDAGDGIYRATAGEAGHGIVTQLGLTSSNYQLTTQQGIAGIDDFSTTVTQTPNKTGINFQFNFALDENDPLKMNKMKEFLKSLTRPQMEN